MNKQSEKLAKAIAYEAKKKKERDEDKRPAFHVTPTTGWCNDPNGFSRFGEEYHLFYQYYPYENKWGPMHWGHCRTKDFIKWEELPCALAPDMEYDGQGCFSGTAVEHEGKHILMYTSVLEKDLEDGTHMVRQTQSIAIGDGENYEKVAENPVITADCLPEGSSPVDFRDPKIWKEDGRFYALIGSKAEDGSGQLALFTSEDALHWNYEKMIDQCKNRYGKMWECPDFFSLEGQEVLSVSPQGLTREEFRFQNIYQSGYFILKDGKPEEKAFREWDHGFDFYAPQTFQDGKDRRIIIGWMGMPDADEEYVNPTAESEGWQHCLTVPREVTYKNGMLYQYPVEELNGLRENGTSISGSSVELPVNGPFDLDIQVKGDQGKVSLGENLFLEYQGGDVILTLSETAGAGRKVRKAHVPSGKVESLRILADTTAVEIYVNGGEVVFSSRYYPETQEQTVKVEAVECDGKIYMLKNYVMV